MKSRAVTLPVIAGVTLDCSFWHEDEGWSGVCKRLSVIVRGSGFADAQDEHGDSPTGASRAYSA